LREEDLIADAVADREIVPPFYRQSGISVT
jgi:hypothetical protein